MVKVAKKGKVLVKETKPVNDSETDEEQNDSELPSTDTDVENEDPRCPVEEKAMTSAINALLLLIKQRKDKEGQKALFSDDPKEIILQVTAIKIPNTCRQEIRIPLPHRLATEGTNVCLITSDVKKSTRNDHEPTIVYYKSLLEEKKIKGITEIVPIRQLRTEYVPYELKGRFANLYDMYLVDGRLYGKVTKLLGSRFFKKNKDLIPVKINTQHVKRELEKALSKTVLSVHGNGCCYTVKVGYSHFSESQLKENLKEIAAVLATKFPGGFDNIRSLHLKSGYSAALPIYLSSKPSNKVPVPLVKPKLPKAYQPVEGELTTMIGTRVTVLPTGEVTVKTDYTQEDVEMGYGIPTMRVRPEEEMEEEDDDDDDVGGDDEDMESDMKPVPAKGKKRKAAAADGDSSDDDVEAAEDAYVMGMHNQTNALRKTDKKDKPTPKLKPAKAKKEVTPSNTVGLMKKNKLQQAGTEEGHGTPGLKATPKGKSSKLKTEPQSKNEAGKIGVSPKKLKISPQVKPVVVVTHEPQSEQMEEEIDSAKKLKATPKVKPGKSLSEPQSENKREKMVSAKKLKATPKVKAGKSLSEPQLEIGTYEISPKKLKATPNVKLGKSSSEPQLEIETKEISPKRLKATPKVKAGKSLSEPQLEIERKEKSPKKLKATPKVKPGKTRKDPEQEEMGLQEMIDQLVASKDEDLEVSTDQPVKSKKSKKTDLVESTPKTKPRGLVRPATEPRDDKVKSKLVTAVKLKKSKRLEDLSASPVDMKTKRVSARLDNLTPKPSLKSPSKTKKQSKTKEANEEEKTEKKTPLLNKDTVLPVMQSRSRYFP